MKISVALATCNGASFLGEQLASLLRQTMAPSELVACDDSSSDTTLEVLHAFARRVPIPVRIYRNDVRLGFADNFVKTASLCESEVVAFCDQDDVWHPEKLARCVVPFQDPLCQMVGHLVEEVDGDLRQIVPRQPDIKRSFVITRGCIDRFGSWDPPIPGCAMVLRREVIAELAARWPRTHARASQELAGHILSHDVASMCVAKGRGSVYILAQPLVKHRNYGRNTWSRDARNRWQRLCAVVSTGSPEYRTMARKFRLSSRFYQQLATGQDFASLLFGDLSAGCKRRAEIYDARAELRETQSFTARLRLLLQMAQRGMYKEAAARSGSRTVIKDVVATVMGGVR